MFSLTIAFGETPAMWRLLFKTEQAANKMWAVAGSYMEEETKYIHIVDDFGQQCIILASDVHACMLEDLDQSRLAGVEMQMHNWKMQATAQARGGTDPELRNIRQPQGPSVFIPQGNGRM